MHLHIAGQSLLASDLFATLLKTGAPFTDYESYHPVAKISLPPRPVETENAKPNPWLTGVAGERTLIVRTNGGFRFEPRELEAKPGEALALVLENHDAIPHNLVLLKPDSIMRVGQAADRMISDPQAFANHYIPNMSDVLVHTSLVNPVASQTIHFKAPEQPGSYPFVCTFPGHWQAMQGVLLVK
ncbi:MAG: hypothetical protein K8R87_03630 [Verrucomicrobia bacterium]|nr:hypothetical protein [Verrucomicrobiota bacterium]